MANQQPDATEITERLYLGSLSAARDRDALERLGITAIVCVAAEGRPYFPETLRYLELQRPPVEHTCGIQDLIVELDRIEQFVMTQWRQKKCRVLVHCVHGRTRSAAVVTYLLAKHGSNSIAEAYAFVAAKRDVFVPEEWLAALQAKMDV